MSVAAAMASAVAVPIALAAVGTLLPLIMFASFGAIFAATAAAMVALTVLGPLLLSFSFFGGMSFVAVAAKAAIIVPSIIIGSTIWAIGSFGLKRSAVGGAAGTAAEEATLEHINVVGSHAAADDNDDEEKGSQWEVSVDKDAGTYCKISRSVELEEGEILENWAEDAVISVPLSQNRNHSFPQGKSARSW